MGRAVPHDAKLKADAIESELIYVIRYACLPLSADSIDCVCSYNKGDARDDNCIKANWELHDFALHHIVELEGQHVAPVRLVSESSQIKNAIELRRKDSSDFVDESFLGVLVCQSEFVDIRSRIAFIKHGIGGNWIVLPQKIVCWQLNYLRPNKKHSEFLDDEDRIICTLFANIRSSLTTWSFSRVSSGRTNFLS